MHLTKVLPPQTENDSPVVFSNDPINFYCEHKPSNTAHSKGRNLDQKRGKDLPNVSTLILSVWKPDRGPYPTFHDPSGNPPSQLILLGSRLTL